MNRTIKPVLRSTKFLALRVKAKLLTMLFSGGSEFEIAFLVGCGRSGTTILGQILSSNPRVSYLNEPYHFWAEINPETDVTGLFGRRTAKYFMSADDVSPLARKKFAALFGGTSSKSQLMVEKTPHNACRVGFLQQLNARAKYVNIVRNGLLVVRSIKVAAEENEYRLLHKPKYNPWWGDDGARWENLIAGCPSEYCSDEISVLHSNSQRAAFEWLVNVREFELRSAELGDNQLTITYQELTESSERTLAEVCDFLSVEYKDSWLEDQKARLRPERSVDKASRLDLPPSLCDMFNNAQEKYGFEGRAKKL